MADRVPITDGLFELDGDRLVLIGGYSPSSGHHHFPLTDTCPYSGARDVERVELSTTGTVWVATTVTLPPPGYRGEVPYGFGVVELPEGLRVVTRLIEQGDGALTAGQEVRLVPEVVYTDDEGREVVTWAFAPVTAGEVAA